MKHIENINNKYRETDASQDEINTESRNIGQTIPAANSAICPKCGAALVVRTVKKGKNAGRQFLGCSNFPKCYYKKQISK